MRKFIVFACIHSFLFIVGTGTSISTSQGDEFPLMTDHFGNTITWKELPITFKINNNVPDKYISSIRMAATAINYQLGTEAIRISPIGTDGIEGVDGDNVIVAYNKHSNLQSNMLAVAKSHFSLWPTGSNFIDADVLINLELINAQKVETDYLTALLVHELYHTLGFKHTFDDSNVMFPRLTPFAVDLKMEIGAVAMFRHANAHNNRAANRSLASISK